MALTDTLQQIARRPVTEQTSGIEQSLYKRAHAVVVHGPTRLELEHGPLNRPCEERETTYGSEPLLLTAQPDGRNSGFARSLSTLSSNSLA